MRNAAILLLGGLVCAGHVGARNQLTAAEKKAGWKLLFDGVDKSQWRVNENGTTNSWIVEDSTLKSPDRGDMLFTKESFGNFEWKLEWKLNKGGNSGLFPRVVAPPGWYCSGYEYAILDDVNGGDRGETSHNPGEDGIFIKRTGAVYDLYPTTQNGVLIPSGGKYVGVAKPYDQWNQGVIWANGNFIEHWLNGQKVVDAEIGTAEWNKRYGNSKFSPGCGDQFSKHPSGLLGVQDHGGGLIIWMRNIKVRAFTPGEKLVTPMFTPNGGTFSGQVKVSLEAAVTGAVIHYTLDGSTPTETSPTYTDTLTVSKTTTVKALAIRPRFQTSDVASAVFTLNGTTIAGRAKSALQFQQAGSRLRLANAGSQALTIDVVALSGERTLSFQVPPGGGDIDLSGLKGLFVLHSSVGTEAKKIALP